MRKTIGFVALALIAQAIVFSATWHARALAQGSRYAVMASLSQYLMPKTSEIALARSAAPASISANAEVMVLGRTGYTVAVKGTNGFLCLVERSWSNPTNAPDYWNPTDRAPTCFNPAAAKTFEPIYFLKTKLALSGKSPAEIHRAIESAFDVKQLPALAPGAMAYMMSKHQYIHPGIGNWYPHVMFYLPGDAAASWGANRAHSPVLASYDPEERATTFFIIVGKWSDGGDPAPTNVLDRGCGLSDSHTRQHHDDAGTGESDAT